MLKIYLLVCGLIWITISNGQSRPLPGPPRPLTEEEEELEETNRECLYQNKLTPEQRLNVYPFKKATKIQIVSFDKPESAIQGQLPIKNRIVDYSKMKESKTLDKAEKDSLSSILYNHVYRGIFHTDYKSLCYNPRNAILFLDSKGKSFAFIEICFECYDNRVSSKKVTTGDFCEGKYDLLKEFFINKGIKFGTIVNPYVENCEQLPLTSVWRNGGNRIYPDRQ